MLLYKVNVCHVCFSLSLVWVAFSAALSLDNFFILGLCGGPLSTVGLVWALECDRATCIALQILLSSCRFFPLLMYEVVDLPLHLEYHYQIIVHSVLWSLVSSLPPWEQTQRELNASWRSACEVMLVSVRFSTGTCLLVSIDR